MLFREVACTSKKESSRCTRIHTARTSRGSNRIEHYLLQNQFRENLRSALTTLQPLLQDGVPREDGTTATGQREFLLGSHRLFKVHYLRVGGAGGDNTDM